LALNAAGQDVSQHVVVPLFEHKDHRRIIQPLAFEKTSANSAAAFLARGSRSRLLLTKDEAVLALPKRSLAASSQRSGNSRQAEGQPALRMKFAGANQGAVITGEDPLPGKIYHANADSKGPLTGSATYRRVKYSGIYPGIDAVYYGNDQQLEFDLIVAPHADPKQIRLSFAGADKISLNESGEIAFHLAGEQIRLKKPAISHERDGIREEIAGGYRLSRSEARFELGAYDKSLPLIIDPTIFFATYLGSSGNESLRQLRVNNFGEIYLLASSNSSSNLPPHQTVPFET